MMHEQSIRDGVCVKAMYQKALDMYRSSHFGMTSYSPIALIGVSPLYYVTVAFSTVVKQSHFIHRNYLTMAPTGYEIYHLFVPSRLLYQLAASVGLDGKLTILPCPWLCRIVNVRMIK